MNRAQAWAVTLSILLASLAGGMAGLAFIDGPASSAVGPSEPSTPIVVKPSSQNNLDLTRTAVIGDSMMGNVGSAGAKSIPEHMSEELRGQGGEFRAWAVDGATALRWTDQYPGSLNTLPAYAPTTIIVMLGGNELVIGRGLDQYQFTTFRLVEKLQGLAPNAEIVIARYYDVCGYGLDCYPIATNPDNCDLPLACVADPATPPSWADYRPRQMKLAEMAQGPFIEIPFSPTSDELYEDKIHLNGTGKMKFAEAFRKAL